MAPSPGIVLRVTTDENVSITEAAAAFGEDFSIADLFVLAGLETAHRQGMSNPRHVSRAIRPFRDKPLRDTKKRFPIRFKLQVFYFELFGKAAEVSDIELADWLVGAFFTTVRRHQKLDPSNEALNRVILPAQYAEL